MPEPRFSLPASSARHAPQSPNNALKAAQGGRKIRPLVYAIGVAGIVGSGALIGAILKMSHQEEAQKVQSPQIPVDPLHLYSRQNGEPQNQPTPRQADQFDYAKSIQTLETKRGHLMGQKIQLERKIQDLRDSQRRRAEEEAEAEKKDFELNK